MKRLIAILLLLLFTGYGFSAELPSAPQAQSTSDYGSGFSFDNQLYALQGASVSLAVGIISHRPWLGAASGVGSCMIWRAAHDQGYRSNPMFANNRILFCAAGAAAGYGTMKLIHIHRAK